jgi:phospholipid transport system substrate-binding protein
MQYRNLAVWTILGCVLVVGGGSIATGDEPQERIRTMLDDIRAVLADKTLQAPAQQQALQAKLYQILASHCDFAAMAQRSLGSHWEKITPAQQQEYQQLVSQLLAEQLVRRIAYRGEHSRQGYGTVPDAIAYTSHTVEPDGTATVRTVMAYAKETATETVDYRLLKPHGTWLVYDVVTEGASMLANYRTQFDQIIRQESYAGLLERLKTSYRHGQALSR